MLAEKNKELLNEHEERQQMGIINIADKLRARSSFMGLYVLHDQEETLKIEMESIKR